MRYAGLSGERQQHDGIALEECLITFMYITLFILYDVRKTTMSSYKWTL